MVKSTESIPDKRSIQAAETWREEERHSDGGLGEGHSKVVVLSKVVVVEFDEAVDGLLNRAHLDQSHLVVLPVRHRRMHFSGLPAGLPAVHNHN